MIWQGDCVGVFMVSATFLPLHALGEAFASIFLDLHKLEVVLVAQSRNFVEKPAHNHVARNVIINIDE
jgi:hypothetical protein